MKLVRLSESANPLMDYALSKKSMIKLKGGKKDWDYVTGPVTALWGAYAARNYEEFEWECKLYSNHEDDTYSNFKDKDAHLNDAICIDINIESEDGHILCATIERPDLLRRLGSRTMDDQFYYDLIDYFDKICRDFNKCAEIDDVRKVIKKYKMDLVDDDFE